MFSGDTHQYKRRHIKLCFLYAERLAPYALQFRDQGMALPWRQLCVNGYDNAPWLLYLPPQARWSLHGLGRYFFSQTPACKRGSVSVDMYGEWVLDAHALKRRTSPADILIKCCAAFAHSPLSIVIDIRAAMQCISRAAKHVIGTGFGAAVAPDDIEQQLHHVCAAGCGKDLPKDYIHFPCFGSTVKYCSRHCAYAVSPLRGTRTRTRNPCLLCA